MKLSGFDWLFIVAYAVFSFGVGMYYSKRASKNISEFFVAGRKISWFIAGTSMVATTFASDTPLVVSGLVRDGGIFKNWLWWSAVMGSVLCVFFFARLWRRAGILTENEFIELRYTGRAASVLRGFNAVYGGLLYNSIVLGWVILAMAKICEALLGWPKITSVGALLSIAVAYTVLSGYWGVVMTDCVQFFIAMGGSILLAAMIVFKMGGPSGMVEQITAAPGFQPQVFAMVPTIQTAGKLLFLTFIIQITVQWWGGGAGGGAFAQRFFSTRTEREAALAALWYNFAQFVLRSWPWIIVGLASIAIFPLQPGEDHEIVYPKMIIHFLPAGLRGLMAASLFAAFMSTVTTQLNWGASYLVNDLYKRFINRTAGDRHYVRVSRLITIGLAACGAFAAWQADNISHAWIYLMTLSAGSGFIVLLRWYWWRVNPWCEITAMLSSLVLANLNIICKLLNRLGILTDATMRHVTWLYSPEVYAVRFAVIIFACTIVWMTVAHLTRPVPDAHLEVFYRRVRPGGWWGHIASKNPDIKRDDMRKAWLGWIFGVTSTYTGLFGVGFVCLGRTAPGLGLLLISAVTIWLMLAQLPSEEIEDMEVIPELAEQKAGDIL